MKTPHKLLIIISLLLILLVLLLCGSCTPAKLSAYHCKRCHTKDSVSTTVESSHSEVTKIDTVKVELPADSAWLKAYIDCVLDSSKHYVPVITYVEREQTNRTRVNVALTGRNLKVDCKTLQDTIELYSKTITYKDSLLQSIYERKVVPCPECPKKTGWGKFIMWTGYLFWILLILYILGRIAWWVFKKTPYGAAFNVPSILSRFGK